MLDAGSRVSGSTQPPPLRPQAGTPAARITAYQAPSRVLAEPSYHPLAAAVAQGAAGSPSSCPNPASGPFALPAGATLSDTAGGTQAQPFDVTMSQLATAVYGTRGDPPAGWSEVTDQDLTDRGITDPTAWREQFLGGGTQTTAQEFKAEVYKDCDGNFVLSYRGTAEGMADWENNFKQGTGFQTDAVDKFSGTAVNTAVEFKRVFGGGDGDPSNLAITGHSQGGGLATVGSLATGISAVTFDASGIHPNTLDRMGFVDPQQARTIAEGGQIRAYSLESDALTNLQEGSPLGLAAPDALGTKVVVKAAAADEHHMFANYGPIELAGKTPAQLAAIDALVETARHTPFLPLGLPLGLLTGGSHVGGSLAYAAISHSPNALTAAMVERQPWQAGYENPTSLGKSLQDAVPDALKDDFARNTHDTASDIVDVVNGDFRNGDYVQGGFRIGGDVVEGAWNSAGDTVHRTADIAAQAVDDRVDGPVGDILAGAISGGGRVVEGAADIVGNGVEKLYDGAGFVAQKGSDFVGWLTGR